MSIEAPSPLHESQRFASPEAVRDQLATHQLHNGESIILSGDISTLYDPGSIGLPRTGYYSVVGEVRIGDSHATAAAIVRERKEGDSAYFLYGLAKDESENVRVSGYGINLTNNPNIIVGREGIFEPGAAKPMRVLWDKSDTYASREHLALSLVGNSIVIEDMSMNGTEVVGVEDPTLGVSKDDIDEYQAEHTVKASELAEKRGFVVKSGIESYSDGRVVVTRDTVIDGEHPAIDIRSWIGGGESIVIDSQKYPKEFSKLVESYDSTLRHLAGRKTHKATEEVKLRAVFETVSQAMEYDLGFVEGVEREEARKAPNGMRKVALNGYLEQGKGVCRHMALTAAWLGGELARNGKLNGKMTTEVNQRQRDNAAHEWARYTAADGTVYIIDPAQKRFGKLTDFIDDKKAWEYFRPGERNKYEALAGGADIDPANIVFGAGRIIPRLWH